MNKLYILRGSDSEERAAYAKVSKLRNCFDSDKLPDLREKITNVLKEGKKKVVVVSGKFDRFYLMQPYLELARKYRYEVQVLRLPGLNGDTYGGEINVELVEELRDGRIRIRIV
tara:strand:+ start:604 stop:945 length:342 start_codon:yes stop_codon:yes gene_type:complete